ncbi:MAG TPA: hypothetical protein VLU25_05190 [Acidobacteriota bacterium]|nr:hypothetical protein [Acidobacteriota bacterium]
MLGVLLVLALLTGVAAMLVVRLAPPPWMGLVVLAGMAGAVHMTALLALAQWRARRLESDFRQAPAQVVSKQGRAFRLYFLAGGLMPVCVLAIVSGVLLLLLGAGHASAALLGAVAGAGVIALLGGLQGLLLPGAARATLALCWKRLPHPSSLVSSPPLAVPRRIWKLLSSGLLITSRYRSVADADLRSPRPALPGLTRVLDRQRTGGGGRPPRLVAGGWTWPARDLVHRALAVAALVLSLFPLMWLAAALLPAGAPPGMSQQLRRLAYSRPGPGQSPAQSSRDSGNGSDSGDRSAEESGQGGQEGDKGSSSGRQGSGQAESGQPSSSSQDSASEGDSQSGGRGDPPQGQEASGGEGGSGESAQQENQGDSGQGSTSGEGEGQSESAGESGEEGYGRSGNDPEMDFQQPLVEVPELNPQEALELDLPPLEDGRPGQQPSSRESGEEPPAEAVSRDRMAPARGRSPAGESSSQRLPNWIRVLWDRISQSSAGDQPPFTRKENP